MKRDAWKEYRENPGVDIGDNVILRFHKGGYWRGVCASIGERSAVVGGVPFHYECIKEICKDDDTDVFAENTISNMASKLLRLEGWE